MVLKHGGDGCHVGQGHTRLFECRVGGCEDGERPSARELVKNGFVGRQSENRDESRQRGRGHREIDDARVREHLC